MSSLAEMIASAGDLLQEVYGMHLGYAPRNTSIKPVHVANGLARSTTEKTYSNTALVHTVRRYVRNQRLQTDEERHSNDEILANYPDAFRRDETNMRFEQDLSDLRTLLFGLLAADGAVFDQPDKTSFTLTHQNFASKDPSDDRCGLFLRRLITTPVGNTSSASDIWRALLSDASDPWTALAMPVMQFATEQDYSDPPDLVAKTDHLFEVQDGQFRSPQMARLRSAYDRLARYEASTGSKLNSIRRLVLFGCFCIYVFGISRWHEVSGGAGPRPPILIDLAGDIHPSVRDASRAHVRRAADAIEGLARFQIEQLLNRHYGDSSQIRAAINTSTELDSYRESATSAMEVGVEPGPALANAIFNAGLEAGFKDHPFSMLVELGRRAGFLAPWYNQGGGGRLGKRYSVSPEFLEILVAATVDRGFPLELPEFLDRLRENFGIVLGRPREHDAIRSNNLEGDPFGVPALVNEDELKENLRRFSLLVIETGLAKSYADGRVVISIDLL